MIIWYRDHSVHTLVIKELKKLPNIFYHTLCKVINEQHYVETHRRSD